MVGTSTSPSAGQGQYSKLVSLGGAGTSYGNISFGHTSAASSLSSGDNVALVCFTDNAGNVFSRIDCAVDATPGSNDHPGRLVFLTTADGASAPTERMRIDNSGRLLVNASSSTQAGSIDAKAQIVSSDFNAALAIRRNQNGDGGPSVLLCHSRGTSNSSNVLLNNGDALGNIRFFGADATGANDFAEGAAISATVDGTPGSDDMPTRLEFKTTADGASSPTERLRISNNGVVTVKNGAVAEIDTLTDASTVTPDFAASCNFTLTFTSGVGNSRTIANPSNLTAGQSGSIFLVQDGTGSRTVSWGSYWDFAGGSPTDLTTTANAVDRVDYIVRSSTSIHAVFTLNVS